MKYKLIKCYPGSPKLGYITNFDENEEDWNTENLIIPPDCTDYPEFWEEVKEPKYEILSLRSYNSGFIGGYAESTLRSNGLYLNDPLYPENKGIYTLEHAFKHGFNIHSIKRLSDGEIFTIGDKLQGFGKITKIKLSSPDYIWIEAPYGDHTNAGCILEYAKKEKEPIFTTEDGKAIYCGDNFWFVDNLWNIGKGVVTHPVFKPLYGYKQFSSEDLARKYVEEHKPQFSKKQVINILKGFDRDINCFDERFDYNLYIERYKDEK